MLDEKIAKLAKEYAPYALELRNAFHERPELSFREVKTARRICQELEAMGIEFRTGCGSRTSVLATLQGREEGRCVLLRADIDGLPITEIKGIPHRSRTPGVMHACGHDGHMAGLLGVAHILTRLRGEFRGTVKLAFEAGAENGGSCAAMIRAGALENPKVDAAFCTHFFGSVKEGEVMVPRHRAFAACDTVNITIQGRGGHASLPHLSADSVVIAGQVITLAQAAVARTVSPDEVGVLSFSTIHGGELFNVLPDQVTLTGSIRNFNPQVREKIHQVLEGLLEGLTAAYGATYQISYTNTLPATVNDPALARFAAGSLAKALPELRVALREEPELASETFSYFSLAVPSCYYLLGVDAGRELPAGSARNHSPTFRWNDKNLEVYLRSMAQLTLDYLEG